MTQHTPCGGTSLRRAYAERDEPSRCHASTRIDLRRWKLVENFEVRGCGGGGAVVAASERDDVDNNDNRIHILLLLLSNRASVSILRCKMNVRDNRQATNVDKPCSTAFYFLFSFLRNKILVFDANKYKNRICGDSSNGKVVHWT